MAIFTCFLYGEIRRAIFLHNELFYDLGCDLVRGEGHLHAEWSVGYFNAYLFVGPFICHITSACTRHIA